MRKTNFKSKRMKKRRKHFFKKKKGKRERKKKLNRNTRFELRANENLPENCLCHCWSL